MVSVVWLVCITLAMSAASVFLKCIMYILVESPNLSFFVFIRTNQSSPVKVLAEASAYVGLCTKNHDQICAVLVCTEGLGLRFDAHAEQSCKFYTAQTKGWFQ